MELTSNYGVTPRMKEIRNYNLQRFTMDLENITDVEVRLYNETSQMYGGVGSSHKENVACRNNTINGLISKDIKQSTLGLKLIELSIIFSNENFYKSLTEYDPLTDEQIATAFSTTVENVRMKKEYDIAVLKLNKDKPKTLIK